MIEFAQTEMSSLLTLEDKKYIFLKNISLED